MRSSSSVTTDLNGRGSSGRSGTRTSDTDRRHSLSRSPRRVRRLDQSPPLDSANASQTSSSPPGPREVVSALSARRRSLPSGRAASASRSSGPMGGVSGGRSCDSKPPIADKSRRSPVGEPAGLVQSIRVDVPALCVHGLPFENPAWSLSESSFRPPVDGAPYRRERLLHE